MLRRWGTHVIVFAATVVVLCSVVGTPRNGGPDEPAHAVASAALVRGDRELLFSSRETPFELYTVPGVVGRPHPCFAMDPSMPASCLTSIPLDPDPWQSITSAGAYPIWGHLAAGLASLVPWPAGYMYLARVLDAAVPLALVLAALLAVRRRSSTAALAVVVGLTPIVWFTFGVVNPSGLAIAGGLALWVGLLLAGSEGRVGWLAAAGWAAMMLSRRDAAFLAPVIVILVCLLHGSLPSEVWRRAGRWVKITVVAAAALQLIGRIGAVSGRAEQVLALAPLLILAAELPARALRSAVAAGRVRHVVAATTAVAAGGVAAALVVVDLLRPDGLSAEMIGHAIGGSGSLRVQLVGVMGWLDAPTPEWAVLCWWVVVTMLATIALVTRLRAAAVGAAILATTFVTAWFFELAGRATVGGSWQGRYSVPLMIGLPLVLVGLHRWSGAMRRVEIAAAIGIWLVLNSAFFTTQQRWGVGVDGSALPWRWDTWDSPLPPVVLLVVHALASAMLVVACVGTVAPRERTEPVLD